MSLCNTLPCTMNFCKAKLKTWRLVHILVFHYLLERKRLYPFHGVYIKDINCIFTVNGEIWCIVTWGKERRKEGTDCWLLWTSKPQTLWKIRPKQLESGFFSKPYSYYIRIMLYKKYNKNIQEILLKWTSHIKNSYAISQMIKPNPEGVNEQEISLHFKELGF